MHPDSIRPLPRVSFRHLATLALGAALLAPSAAAQGETGYLRGKGHLDVVLSYTLDTYDRFWVGNNKVAMPGVGTVDRTGYGLYAAYGLTDDVDAIVSGAYIEAESNGAGGFPTEKDLQDAHLSVKWRVMEDQFDWGQASIALLPGVKIPMDTDYQNNSITAIGDGQIDWKGRIVAQVQTNQGLFCALETGYDRRNGAPKDEVPVHLTLGGTVANRLTISPFLSHVASLGGTNIGPPGTNFFPSNEEDFTRTGVSLYLRITDNFGLAGSWRTTIDGKNTGDVDGLSGAVVFRM